jgi:hypothetical protein
MHLLAHVARTTWESMLISSSSTRIMGRGCPEPRFLGDSSSPNCSCGRREPARRATECSDAVAAALSSGNDHQDRYTLSAPGAGSAHPVAVHQRSGCRVLVQSPRPDVLLGPLPSATTERTRRHGSSLGYKPRKGGFAFHPSAIFAGQVRNPPSWICWQRLAHTPDQNRRRHPG